MNDTKTSSGASQQANTHWRDRLLFPSITYALVGVLLFMYLPSRFRPPLHVNSDAAANSATNSINSATTSIPDQPLSGGIYVPQSADHLLAQTGTHLLVRGWFTMREPRVTIRNIELMLDDRPFAEAYVFQVQADPSGKAVVCQWTKALSFAGVEGGDHRLKAVALLNDGTMVQLDEKKVTVWN